MWYTMDVPHARPNTTDYTQNQLKKNLKALKLKFQKTNVKLQEWDAIKWSRQEMRKFCCVYLLFI